MARGIRSISVRLFSSFLSVTCLALFSGAAGAQVVGCNPAVMNAMNARAQAQMAYDIAVTNEMIDKPDSVLDLTCFSNAAGVSAAVGGSIFSGDFTAGLNPVVATSPPPFNCTAMNDLWTAISTEGVNTSVPYATFDHLMTGTIPLGAGADYTTSWGTAAAAGIFSGLGTAVAALPAPRVLDFSAARSSCEVLVIAGIGAGPCP